MLQNFVYIFPNLKSIIVIIYYKSYESWIQQLN